MLSSSAPALRYALANARATQGDTAERIEALIPTPKLTPMPYFILALAAATILLIGCGGSLEERQERARNVLEQTKATVLETVEGTKEATTTVTNGLTGVTGKIQETATDIQKRAETFTDGVEKITGAISSAKEGAEEVKGALKTEKE